MPPKKTTVDKLKDAGVSVTSDGQAVIETQDGLVKTDPENALRRIKRGEASPESAVEKAVRGAKAQRKKFVEGPAEAARTFGETALDTGTLGLSTLALRGMGADMDEMLARRESHPLASGLGIATGIGLGIGGLAGGIGKITPLGALTAGTAKLGKKVGGIAGGLLEGGIEGGMFGLGQTASDLALQNKDLISESSAGELLSGAFKGTVAGGLFGAVGGGISKLRARAFSKAALKSEEGVAFVNSLRAQAQVLTDISEGLATPVTFGKVANEAAANAIDATIMGVPAAKKAINSALGLKGKGFSFDKVFKKLPELKSANDLGKVLRGFQQYDDAVRAVATRKGLSTHALDEYQAAVIDNMGILRKSMQISPGTKAMDLLQLSVESAELAKITTGADVIPGGPMGEAIAFMWAVGRGSKRGSMLGKMLGKTARSGAALAGQRVMQQAVGGPGLVGAAKGAVGAVFGRKVMSDVFDKAINGLGAREASSVSRTAGAMRRFLGSAGKRGSIASTATVSITDMLWEERRGRNKAEKYANKLRELHTLADNPKEMLKKVHAATADLSALNPELGDQTKRNMMMDITYMSRNMPRDPGNLVNIAGKSIWLPSSSQMHFMDQITTAIADPPSTVEKLASGRMTPEAAQALKQVKPEHFAEAQRMLVESPEDVAKLPTSKQFELGVLYEVATHHQLANTAPLQATYVDSDEEKQAQQKQVQAKPQGATNQIEPTTAQQLTNKEF